MNLRTGLANASIILCALAVVTVWISILRCAPPAATSFPTAVGAPPPPSEPGGLPQVQSPKEIASLFVDTSSAGARADVDVQVPPSSTAAQSERRRADCRLRYVARVGVPERGALYLFIDKQTQRVIALSPQRPCAGWRLIGLSASGFVVEDGALSYEIPRR